MREPSVVTVDPSGKFTYVANGGSGTLGIYDQPGHRGVNSHRGSARCYAIGDL
jgi:DNA-binding beta-propeller fold protein YncE